MSRPELRLIQGGRPRPRSLPACGTLEWRENVTYTRRMVEWADEQGPMFVERVVKDAFYYHALALAKAGWILVRYADIKTHHRAIRARQVSDLTVHTRCLGNGQAVTTLDARIR